VDEANRFPYSKGNVLCLAIWGRGDTTEITIEVTRITFMLFIFYTYLYRVLLSAQHSGHLLRQESR